MFFTYVFRELRRRHRQALLTALGLAVGVALVVAVTAYAVRREQGAGQGAAVALRRRHRHHRVPAAEDGPGRLAAVRHEPAGPDQTGQEVRRARACMTSPGQQSISTKKLAQIAALDGVERRHRQHQHDGDEREREVRPGAERLERRPSPRRAASRPSGGSSSSSQQGQAQMSPINVSQLTRLRRRHHRPQPRAPQLRAGGLRPLAHERRLQRQGRPGDQGLRQAELAQGRRHQEDRRHEVHHRRHRRPAQRQHLVRALHPPQVGAEAQRQRRQGQPDLRQGRQRHGHRQRPEARSRRSCPRRP